MKKPFILLLAFYLILSNQANCQDTNYLSRFADTLFAQGKFEESLQCYQRMYFFGINSEENCLKSAQCFAELGDYRKAIKSIEIAQRITQDDSTRAAYGFTIVATYISNDDPKLGLLELYNIDTLNNTTLGKRWRLYFGVIQFYMGNYEQSNSIFNSLIYSDKAKISFESIQKDQAKAVKMQPYIRALWSLIPGLSQAMHGYWAESFQSIIATAVFGTMYVLVLKNYGYLDAILSIAPWFNRYYNGGIQKAAKLIIEKKDKKLKATLNRTLELVGSEN